MIRRPPRSTLFPSTPLFRSTQRRAEPRHCWRPRASPPAPATHPGRRCSQPPRPHGGRANRHTARNATASTSRSEEHTSELQSQSNLVCRLLLEKKKKTHHTTPLSWITPHIRREPKRKGVT